jgi:hypothetical protein
MAEILAETGQAADAVEGRTVRVPANMWRLIRQSYDSREKVLDWCLAIGVVIALVWAFRDQLLNVLWPVPDPNAGRSDAPLPNQDVATALPAGNPARSDIYTYNMPVSRQIKYGSVPSGVGPPSNPSLPPLYPVEEC